MSIPRIDLSAQIKKWLAARKGKEVRGANVEAFEKIQSSVNAAIDGIEQTATDVAGAITRGDKAISDANAATARANATVDHADDILNDATAQASASAASAKTSQSWAVGGTGIRSGEDQDNSRYHSLESKTAAERSRQAAEKAETYAGFVIPDFVINFVTGNLEYTSSDDIRFTVNRSNGNLEYVLL